MLRPVIIKQRPTHLHSEQISIDRQFYAVDKIVQPSHPNLEMNPWFVTGFLDGEGCFLLTIFRDTKRSIGWQAQLWFSVTLDKKDEALLIAFKNYFNMAGYIAKHREDSLIFRASSKEDLIVVINHFNKYNLITQKRADFELRNKAFYIVQNKGHLTMKGIEKLVAIKSSLNRGLSDESKSAFPNASLITGEDTERPLV